MAVLADLKHLLIEAKQKLPPFLASVQTEHDQLNEDLGELFNGLLYFSHSLKHLKTLEAASLPGSWFAFSPSLFLYLFLLL